MIPADAGAEIARLLRDAVTAGDLPRGAAALPAAGTWRPAPAQVGGGPGTYATSLPLSVARLAGRAAGPVAERLATGLSAVPWVSSAWVTGGGYVTVRVTAGHLAALPGRIVAAGPAAVAASTALAGVRLTAPSLPDPAAAANWEQAWRTQRDALVGRLARAAGATVVFIDGQRDATADPPSPPGSGQVPASVAHHGADAVRYALARTSAPRPGVIARQLGRPLDLANPFVLVTYAHGDAASTLRWAADLRLMPGVRAAGEAAAGQELRPLELALVDAMSWFPERVAAAARRARPADLTACLEHVAGAWLDCAEYCPALPFRGLAAPADPGGPQAAARLGLADAARVVLAAGLGLLGVSAPVRN